MHLLKQILININYPIKFCGSIFSGVLLTIRAKLIASCIKKSIASQICQVLSSVMCNMLQLGVRRVKGTRQCIVQANGHNNHAYVAWLR